MIEIRPDQMQMFAARRRSTFARRVADHLCDHYPEAASMPPAELDGLIQRQITAAAGFDIQTEAAVVQFIELGLVFGEDFHSSGEFPAAEAILAGDLNGVMKMQKLQELARQGLGGTA